MNKYAKIGFAVTAGAATVAGLHAVNKIIFSQATSGKVTDIDKKQYFSWKFGNIAYTVKGSGSPVLLLHNLDSASSSYEWKKVTDGLKRKHTVYAIDLLGCGYSDKPNITYTAYMYTQLINDFVSKVIGEKTSIVATGTSAPIAIMSVYCNSDNFDKIILVSPQSVKKALINPDKNSNIRRIILNSPILGTFIYNMCVRRCNIKRTFNSKFLGKNYGDLIEAYHENAHLNGSSSKYLYTSSVCRYTTSNIVNALKNIDNCIYIISGKNNIDGSDIASEYRYFNPAIEYAQINNAKAVPQLEQPTAFVKMVSLFLSE